MNTYHLLDAADAHQDHTCFYRCACGQVWQTARYESGEHASMVEEFDDFVGYVVPKECFDCAYVRKGRVHRAVTRGTHPSLSAR